jgi:hypothetical protein
MEISGTLFQINEPITGNGKNGMWKKQEFIIEIPGQYPKKVMISAWGDKLNLESFKPGTQVTVGIDLESREYNGKWYTDVKAWKIGAGGGAQMAQPEPESQMAPPPYFDNGVSSADDDLPF